MSSKLSWPPHNIPATVHGTCVASGGNGVLFVGPSGSGKSSLAVQLISLGAKLVSDDLVQIASEPGGLVASLPTDGRMIGKIEARGLGLLSVPRCEIAVLKLVVDLSVTSSKRLPEPMQIRLGDHDLRCIHNVDNPAFPAMVLLFLQQAKSENL